MKEGKAESQAGQEPGTEKEGRAVRNAAYWLAQFAFLYSQGSQPKDGSAYGGLGPSVFTSIKKMPHRVVYRQI